MTRRPSTVGHRGARGLFPENTLEGFRACLAMGLRRFELDVGMTRDDVLVVHHDPALNPAITRDAAGQWLREPGPLLRDLTHEQLRSYDVGRIRLGTPYRLLHRYQKGRDGVRVPTLAEVLRLAPDAEFIIELKTDPRHPDWTVAPEAMAEAVLAEIEAAGVFDRVTVESFDWRGPLHLRRLRPDLRLAWLTHPGTVRDAELWWGGIASRRFNGSVPAAIAACGGPIWAPAFAALTRAEVDEAHARGVLVMPWTVNTRAATRRLANWGVDFLITDRPDVTMAVLDAAAEDQSARS